MMHAFSSKSNAPSNRASQHCINFSTMFFLELAYNLFYLCNLFQTSSLFDGTGGCCSSFSV